MPPPNAIDWRQNAKGAHHYLDAMADTERRLGTLLAEAEARRGTGEEISGLIGKISAEIRTMSRLASDVNAEKVMLDRWIASQTSGLLGRMAGGAGFVQQFDEQYEIYLTLINGSVDSLAYFNERLAALGRNGAR